MQLLGALGSLLIAVSLLGCAPSSRSDAFACDTIDDCDPGRVCQQGWCVRPGGTLPDSGPPNDANQTSDAQIDAPGCGPVSVDNQVVAAEQALQLTWNHQTGTGSNRYLVVGVAVRQDLSMATVETVTYGGTELMQIHTTTLADEMRTELWALTNPASGNNPVVVTLSSSERVVAGSVSFVNVDQNTPVQAMEGASGTDRAPTTTIASSLNGLVLDCVGLARGDASILAGGSQVESWNTATGGGGGGINGSGSVQPGAPSVTMLWAIDRDSPWALSAMSIQGCTD